MLSPASLPTKKVCTVWPVPSSSESPLKRVVCAMAVISCRSCWNSASVKPRSVLEGTQESDCADKIGRAHVRTTATNAQLVCRLLLEIKNKRRATHDRQAHDKTERSSK